MLTSSAVSGVFHTWTIDEVHQFEHKHPIGSKARLALALLLYTGVRRSEVVELGRQMERGGAPHISEKKGANSRALGRKKSAAPKWHVLPILPALRAVIDATPSGTLAFLVTSFGQPFTAAGFGNKFRAWCNEAGLQHCSAHGLRKAGATIAAENGATETGSNPLISLKGKREWCPGAACNNCENSGAYSGRAGNVNGPRASPPQRCLQCALPAERIGSQGPDCDTRPFRGVGFDGEDLRVYVRPYVRDLYLYPYGSLDEVPELSAVFVLTLGAGDIDDDIYNELRQELGAFVEAATVELDIDIDDEE